MSKSAMGAAWCRLVEQSQPPEFRQFVDPVVGGLLDPMLVMGSSGPMQAQLLEGLGPGIYGGQIMRTRYIDDVVTRWTEGGASQLVILGAGLDTRAYRLPSLAGTTVYEADLPDTQRLKRQRLGRTPLSAREIRFVPIDFDTQPLGAALAAAGFDAGRQVLFVWEGVTQYLSEDAVRSTLRFVGECAAGSAIVFTYILRSVVEGDPSRAGQLPQWLGPSEPWRFGLDPAHLRAFLGGFCLRLVEDVGDADYQTRYLHPIGRRLVVNDFERVALAIAFPA